MTKEQLEIIIAMLAGQSAAIVHLSSKVAEISGLDKKEFADSYRGTANLLAKTTRNREIIAMTLNQIANGMDSSQPAGPKDISDDIRDMLH
ncbi:hypothetical protein [Edwardsiella piscicida]|uniref:hypothetical protein n=1 Tax=Edwardsiella piscicida TaxID=1263550 RepID=UPI00084BD871|nr:hypothetical protein [Edwardsiella piscicida]AOP43719.1 hypothetical protein A9797_12100 [Edwardsiella piscicida]EKS7766599.1 hypothetical protein [Edwardsiella piscicida]UCQ30317.1 hypothetical protein DCF74_12580 [Edwardsiella piscicida]UCQ56642.1 hypothetical protein DCF40_12540 [Edwardsiella piscicida]